MKIHTQNLVKQYGKRTVVNNVSFEVSQGEIVGLLGPNGAGKTTSFYMVVGLVKPDKGQVFLNDEDITKLPMYKRAQMGIGYLPQEASIFRKLSVADNISAVLEMTKLTRAEQLKKLEEEFEELKEGIEKKDQHEVVDAVGDMTVVLILLSELAGFKFETALLAAYDVIKHRTGRMAADGTFVKDKP